MELLTPVYEDRGSRTLMNNALLGTQLQREDGSWSVCYNFDQYLYSKPGSASSSLRDHGRKANSFHKLSIGFGGEGMYGTRERSIWHRYYYLDIADKSHPSCSNGCCEVTNKAVESYYSFALRRLHVTPGVQIIDPARRDTKAVVVLGFRMKIDCLKIELDKQDRREVTGELFRRVIKFNRLGVILGTARFTSAPIPKFGC